MTPECRGVAIGLLLVVAWTCRPARAEVVPHPLFSDGAVLQSGRPVPVWGAGAEGEAVRVTIQGKSARAVSRDGRWRVELPPLDPGGPFEMVVEGTNTRTIRDLLVGEVWVCSGQSNMDLTVADCDRGAEEVAGSANRRIRLCKVPRRAADTPQETTPVRWRACGPESVAGFSGVGYFFGRDLQAALGVPVGLIDAAYGGTPAEAWMSPEALRSRPEFRDILEEYCRQVEDSPRAMRAYHEGLAAWERDAAGARAAGRNPPPRPALPLGPFNWRRPSGLSHGMVAPLAPYAVRAVIWYQGERNTPRAHQYRTLFPALIGDWRDAWHDPELPFLFVQLAPFGKPATSPRESLWAELRDAQLLASRTVPRTAMAVITDCGDEVDIHPRRKQPVGERLARAAQAVAHGRPVAYRGPAYRSFEVQGDRVIVSFDHAGKGLVCRGERPRGFATCGPDRRFVEAEAEIAGDRVIVRSPTVSEPVAVRFGWADFPVVDLWNEDGLPASPFRTDDFPGATRPRATPDAPAPSRDPSTGRDLYVDPASGDDRRDGLVREPRGDAGPVASIARGIKLARPGDVVHLAPAIYRESIVFHNRKGEPGRPIVLDGHGAILEGSDPLRPADWERVAPGLYRCDRLLRPDLLTRDDAIVRRWFFLFDGRMSHMGRTSKGPAPPLKPPEELEQGEWTIRPEEHAFYVRIDPSRSLADARIAAPLRSSAVVIAGDSAHLLIRNVTGRHVQNDGYNIHGSTRDVRFENIAAIECGDDGFSAHDDCRVEVDGFLSAGNSTGITNTGHSQSINRRVRIEDCLGVDLFFLDEGIPGKGPDACNRHTLIDSVVLSKASSCVIVDGTRGVVGPCRLRLENVLIRRIGRPGEALVGRNSELSAERATLLGPNLTARGGAVELHHSLVAGPRPPAVLLSPGVTWRADFNAYDLSSLRWNGRDYARDQLAEYRRDAMQDEHSAWGALSVDDGKARLGGDDVGVDPSRLPVH